MEITFKINGKTITHNVKSSLLLIDLIRDIMKLKGKAENLDILVKIFKRSNIKIPKYFYFSIKEYKKSKNSVINRTKKFLKRILL